MTDRIERHFLGLDEIWNELKRNRIERNLESNWFIERHCLICSKNIRLKALFFPNQNQHLNKDSFCEVVTKSRILNDSSQASE